MYYIFNWDGGVWEENEKGTMLSFYSLHEAKRYIAANVLPENLDNFMIVEATCFYTVSAKAAFRRTMDPLK